MMYNDIVVILVIFIFHIFTAVVAIMAVADDGVRAITTAPIFQN